jgi:hypothetical protein
VSDLKLPRFSILSRPRYPSPGFKQQVKSSISDK